MGFWSILFSTPNHADVTPNENPPGTPPTVGGADYTPGDPDGLVLEDLTEEPQNRTLPFLAPSPWDGWPEGWSTQWQQHQHLSKLVDTAWFCLDLNSSILSTMPLYRMRSGDIQKPLQWMVNPDPDVYTGWDEFAKQLFWDYMLGEAFVLPSQFYADSGFPSAFRVIPPWMVSVEIGFDRLTGARRREYRVGSVDVTDDILHIRYKSTTEDARGHGPLEAGAGRMVAAEVLQRYVKELPANARPPYWIEDPRQLNKGDADGLLEQFMDSRVRNLGRPAVMWGGTTIKSTAIPSTKDMALLELSQFTEARIAVLLGVPPRLAALPSGGDPMTYSNVESEFDFHDRWSLRTKARSVMSALSGWALPRGQTVELNRDEYTRPAFNERVEGYVKLNSIEQDGKRAISIDEIRTMERLTGDAPEVAASALTGGDEL